MPKTSYDKITEWNKESSGKEETVFVSKLIRSGLRSADVLIVLKAIDTTCNHCWDGDSSCKCWDDE